MLFIRRSNVRLLRRLVIKRPTNVLTSGPLTFTRLISCFLLEKAREPFGTGFLVAILDLIYEAPILRKTRSLSRKFILNVVFVAIEFVRF